MESQFVKKSKLVLPDVIIDEDTAPLYCKRQKLFILDAADQQIGHANVNISVVQSCNHFEFTVHKSSKFETEQLGKCGMTLTSRIKPSLTTVEEKRHEFATYNNVNSNYHLYLAKLKKNFYISSMFDTGKTHLPVKKRSYRTPIRELYNFISEGANILILKNFALNQLHGKLKTRTLLMNGDICSSALIASPEKITIDNITYDTTKVTRLIKVPINSTILKVETWLNEKGHILLHKWNNTDFKMQFDSTLDVDLGYIPLEKSWENDLQLSSLYLDRLERLKSLYTSYSYDQPQAEELLNDFVLLILMRKPDDVIEFAIDYFTSIGI